MRITIQMELKLTTCKTPGPLRKYMHVLNYNCTELQLYGP